MDWTEYFDTQAGRRPRSVLLRSLDLRAGTSFDLAAAVPGASDPDPGGPTPTPASPPGTAVDLGCGEGTETRHLLAAGWTVHAFDADPGSEFRVRQGLGRADQARLTFHRFRFEDLPELPAADLVYAGFSLPFCDPAVFPELWDGIRKSLNPGAWFAGEFFGPHDDWAGRADMNFHDRGQVAALLAGLHVVSLVEEDRPGQSAFGPRHWHLFHVIARTPDAPA
ncbi:MULTISPECIES: class I SAM-dependent methyltransferase [Cryobacterium]|uniref:Class I SAM-dependent methyltransferase n=1 Tax=Cryobacterium breve TaxID=1259258 RepID=A0ABY2J2I4_9MICO|nr:MULTISPECIES: class I SAM-dependent methyltransferase [Cryobacterium]TFC94227.1 class I SAM-dependent methyltransferase [Cryobacterium sp. TmT3-12]TFC98562.1 class I SAM-dependent methyltransferase [Cryobacterium breve]